MHTRQPADDLRELALAVALLCAVGFSIVLCVQVAWLDDPFAFLTKNRITSPQGRTTLLGTLGLGVALPALVALLVRARLGSAAQRPLTLVARLLSPLALLGLLPGLFSWRLGHGQPMFYLTLLAILALLLRPALEQSIASARQLWPRTHAASTISTSALARVLPLAVVVLGSAGYAAYMSYYTILNHHLIQTTAFDLGIYDNLMFNALHGHPFHAPILFGPGERNYLAGHAELAMLLFVPFYAIAPGPETLLVIQATVLGFAAVPLYLLAAQSLPRWTAMFVAVVYLLFAPLHQPNFYDFHWLPLAVFFHFWAYFALATRRNWLFWAAIAVLLMIREDISVGTAVLGAFLALTTNRARLGIALTIVSTVWFILIKFVMMPSFGTWWFDGIYKGLFADGQQGYGSVVKTLLSNPVYAISTLLTEEKAAYLLHMTAALAFLPVRRTQLWLLAAPGALFTILTTEYWPTTSIRFQYTAHWIPFLFLAVVLSLGTLRDGAQPAFVSLGAGTRGLGDEGWDSMSARVRLVAWTMTLVACAVCHSYAFGAVLQREKAVGGFRDVRFEMNSAEATRYAALRQVADMIPVGASVAATEYMSPHVSTRRESYVPRQDVGAPDYVFVSNKEVHGGVRKVLMAPFSKRPYVLVANTGQEFYLFKLGKTDAATAGALRKLRLSEHAAGSKER